MKVLLLNGSPNEKGCIYTVFSEVARAFEEGGIKAEIAHIKKNCTMGCTGYGACFGNGNRCIFDGGIVNGVLDKMGMADDLIVGSSVYPASPAGAMLSLFDRISMVGNRFYLKPTAVVVSAGRVGTTATVDVLDKYLNPTETPIVSSSYYNVIHGHASEETRQDEEGIQTMRTFGGNMVWMPKCMEAGREKGPVVPEKEPKIKTDYIR